MKGGQQESTADLFVDGRSRDWELGFRTYVDENGLVRQSIDAL